jgi:hypothetical protein
VSRLFHFRTKDLPHACKTDNRIKTSACLWVMSSSYGRNISGAFAVRFFDKPPYMIYKLGQYRLDADIIPNVTINCVFAFMMGFILPYRAK